jgi:hypothetical protein
VKQATFGAPSPEYSFTFEERFRSAGGVGSGTPQDWKSYAQATLSGTAALWALQKSELPAAARPLPARTPSSQMAPPLLVPGASLPQPASTSARAVRPVREGAAEVKAPRAARRKEACDMRLLGVGASGGPVWGARLDGAGWIG